MEKTQKTLSTAGGLVWALAREQAMTMYAAEFIQERPTCFQGIRAVWCKWLSNTVISTYG